MTETRRDPRYDILFEPIKIGPVTAPNRFYSVPHATGHSPLMPNGSIGMRETKAEGGWARGVHRSRLPKFDHELERSRSLRSKAGCGT